MNSDQCTVLKRLLETQMWEEALAKVDELLVSNPLAAQLYLLRGQLIQLQRENTRYSLNDAEKSFKMAVELDATYFDALVELMHFYDAVCPDTPKAIEYARKVKVIAQKVLDEASTVLEEEVGTSA
jgi:tetratricopeptide (TPR) repeat protein